MNPQTFDAAVEAGRMALGSMAQGDAGPSTALWSQRDDVVLANPLGPPIVGFPLVAAETARVASMFVGGEQPEFDEVARWEATISATSWPSNMRKSNVLVATSS